MKKLIVLVLSFFIVSNVLWAQSWTYSNKLHSNTNVSALQTTSGPDGKVVTLGTFSGSLSVGSSEILTSFGARDYFVVKFTDDANIDWISQLGSTGNEYVSGGICACFDGNVYVTGGFRNDLQYFPASAVPSLTSTGAFDIFLAKYDTTGTLLWCQNIGSGALNQRPTSLKVDNSGNVLVGGFFTDSITIDGSTTLYSDDGVDDYFYSKFDADGLLLWAKQIRSFESINSGRILAIDATDDSYFFAGIFADSVIFETDTIVSQSNSYDIHVFKTTLDGDLAWIRGIGGKDSDQCYGIVADQDNNVYMAGYYFETDTLFIDENDVDISLSVGQNKGQFDFVTAKYDSDGNLQWFRTDGGKGLEKLNDVVLNEGNVVFSGYFADTLMWGGVELTTNGLGDLDMFIGELTTDGEYRSANSFGGSGNSTESARSLYFEGITQHTIIRSNSETLVLGDSIYTSPGGIDYIVYGAVGCLPISVDQTIPTNITTCHGDSTGSIQVVVSGGFGSPWQYSIDNGINYSDLPLYSNLTAGDYQVVVIDQEGCSQTGPLITLTQPDSLEVVFLNSDNIVVRDPWASDDGSISVAAQGGTAPYVYWTYPDSALQVLGSFQLPADGYAGVTEDDTLYYRVAVDDVNGCGPVLTDTIIVYVITGFETKSGVEVSVYPNPTSGNITIELPYAEPEVELEVLNMSGQVVIRKRVYSNGGVINETLDLSDHAKGLYMIRIDGEALQSAIMVK